MSFALIADIGGATSNSYAEAADASAYFCTVIGGDALWSSLSTGAGGEQELYLIHATRMVDRCGEFFGQKVDFDQALEFPRSTQQEQDEIPKEILEAVYEQVLCLIKAVQENSGGGGLTCRQELQAEGVISTSQGGASETFHLSALEDIGLCSSAKKAIVSGGWGSPSSSVKLGRINVCGRYHVSTQRSSFFDNL